MPRRRKFRTELIENGVVTSSTGLEIGRVDLVEGTYTINERALYKFLLSTQFYQGRTPATRIYKVFGPTGGWTSDPVVETTLLAMEEMKLIEIEMDKGEIIWVKPLKTYAQAARKLPKYTTRAEQLAGLQPLEDEE